MTPEYVKDLISKGKNLNADELPVNQATIEDINKDKFDDYFLREFKVGYENLGLNYDAALKAKRVMKDGRITLAGFFFLAKHLKILNQHFVSNVLHFMATV